MRTGTTYPVRPQIILGATLGVFVGGLTLSISRLSLYQIIICWLCCNVPC